MVFWGVCFFWGFNIKRFVFGVSGIVSSVTNACFPSFGGFSGVAYCCSSGFGRFRCFCVSCVCFSFLCCVCFCLFAVLLVLWLDVVVLFVLCFLFFLFFGGLKGQVRWPKGPPHLALNPPYLFCFSFFCVFVVLFFFGFLFFWRV